MIFLTNPKMINPAITAALARAAAIKDALASAAGNAGHFAMDEARGTIANLTPSAIAGRYRAVDQAHQATSDDAARASGWPGGTAQYAEWAKTQPPLPDSTNVLGDLAHGLANAYRKITKKK